MHIHLRIFIIFNIFIKLVHFVCVCACFPRGKLCLHMVGKADYPPHPPGLLQSLFLGKEKDRDRATTAICLVMRVRVYSYRFIHSFIRLGFPLFTESESWRIQANLLQGRILMPISMSARYSIMFFIFFFQLYDHKCPKGPLIYITNFCAFLRPSPLCLSLFRCG